METYDDKLKKMLREIDDEVNITRRFIGKDKLNPKVLAAMSEVPRHEFVPKYLQPFAYHNGALEIGHGQTISQPYIVAIMTDLLDVDENSVVLEIGTGSGYQAAVLSRLVKKVYSMEVIPQLSQSAGEIFETLEYNNIELLVGNGYSGCREHAPYDGIIVTAAADSIPDELIEQLKPDANLLVPVGQPHSTQDLLLVKKHRNGLVSTRFVLAVVFVPLVKIPGPNQYTPENEQ